MVWILLPAFNEEDSLPSLLPKIDEALNRIGAEHRIIVVNDGSFDQTAKIIEDFSKSYSIETVIHTINRGLGETERDGFEYIAAKCDDGDIIVRMDCDDTHEPEYIEDMVKKISDGYDVVIASRFQPSGGQKGVDGYRAFISYSANIFMKLMFNIYGVKDYSCGYRAYRGKLIKDVIKIFGNGFIQLKGLGFTSTLETIVKLKLMGCKFSEVPFVLRYDQKVSQSKMISTITTFGYFTMAFLYHWPFGGWRVSYKGLAEAYQASDKDAVEEYAREKMKRSMFCRFGGG